MYIMQNEQTVKKEALKKDSETVQPETEHRDSNQPSEVSLTTLRRIFPMPVDTKMIAIQ